MMVIEGIVAEFAELCVVFRCFFSGEADHNGLLAKINPPTKRMPFFIQVQF